MTIRTLILTLIFAGLPSLCAASDAQMSDYAYGLHIKAKGGGAIYRLSIPSVVYSAVTRPDYADIAVFNGNGEPVPFTLVSPAVSTERPQMVDVPVFPIPARTHEADNLSLMIKRDPYGTIISVNTNEARAEEKPSAFILDATSVGKPVTALTLNWEARDGANGILSVGVEYSDDLSHWIRADDGAALASLTLGGRRLHTDRIEIGGITAKYFRILPTGDILPEIKGVKAEVAPLISEPTRSWTRVQGRLIKKDEYLFTLSGKMPIDRLKVALPQKNTVAEAKFYSRAEEKGHWHPAGGALLYNLQSDDKRVENPDVRICPTGDRYWTMDISPVGGGIGSGLPMLEAGWTPHQLVFAARGNGPFILAYGCSRPQAACDTSRCLPTELLKDETLIKPATASGLTVLGGEAALTNRPRAPEMKLILLWFTLIAGVATLAWMASRLYRQMNK